jgi:hypothetical protein
MKVQKWVIDFLRDDRRIMKALEKIAEEQEKKKKSK